MNLPFGVLDTILLHFICTSTYCKLHHLPPAMAVQSMRGQAPLYAQHIGEACRLAFLLAIAAKS